MISKKISVLSSWALFGNNNKIVLGRAFNRSTYTRMIRLSLITTLSLITDLANVAFADFVISPSANIPESQSGADFPFLLSQSDAPSARLQQIYGGQDFRLNPTLPVRITQLSFQPVLPQFSTIDVNLPNIAIRLSTTARAVDGLSNTFAENLGADETAVFSGPLHFFSDGSAQFPVKISFQTPFVFDPTAGNLLVDYFNYQTLPNRSGGYGQLLAQVSSLDTTSNTDAINANAMSGGVGTLGLVTRFTVTPVPEPSTRVMLALAIGGFGLYCRASNRQQPAGISTRKNGTLFSCRIARYLHK